MSCPCYFSLPPISIPDPTAHNPTMAPLNPAAAPWVPSRVQSAPIAVPSSQDEEHGLPEDPWALTEVRWQSEGRQGLCPGRAGDLSAAPFILSLLAPALPGARPGGLQPPEL